MRINLTTYGGIRTFMAIGLDATFHCKKAKWLKQKAQITKCLIGVIANFWPLNYIKAKFWNRIKQWTSEIAFTA